MRRKNLALGDEGWAESHLPKKKQKRQTEETRRKALALGEEGGAELEPTRQNKPPKKYVRWKTLDLGHPPKKNAKRRGVVGNS